MENISPISKKASPLDRILSKALDIPFLFCLVIFLGKFGHVLACVALILLETEQFSLGKRIMKLKTISLPTEQEIDYKTSIIKNSIPLFFVFFSIFTFSGFIFSIILLTIYTLAETFFLLYLNTRLSDQISNTTVIKL